MTTKTRKTANTNRKTRSSHNRRREQGKEKRLFDRLNFVNCIQDEEKKALAEFIQTLLDDLAPRSAYERTLAGDIIALSWEKMRMIRIRDNLLINKTEEEFQRYFRDMLKRCFDGSVEKYEEAMLLPDFSEEQKRAAALSNLGLKMSDLIAEAYQGNVGLKRDIEELDHKITDLEDSRRRLMVDYEKLQYKNRQCEGAS